ncbi:hypothetical protein HDU99_007044, partial [Rhizoclosmatium hyalinum]
MVHEAKDPIPVIDPATNDISVSQHCETPLLPVEYSIEMSGPSEAMKQVEAFKNDAEKQKFSLNASTDTVVVIEATEIAEVISPAKPAESAE